MTKRDPAMHKRLCEEIFKLGDSNYKIAEKIGCCPSNVYQWLAGERVPYAYYLAKLHYAGCDIIYILTGERHV